MTSVFHMNRVDFNEKINFYLLSLCCSFSLLWFPQIWMTPLLGLQLRLLSSIRAIDFHGHSALAAPKIFFR
jgi:hypothetical protein